MSVHAILLGGTITFQEGKEAEALKALQQAAANGRWDWIRHDDLTRATAIQEGLRACRWEVVEKDLWFSGEKLGDEEQIFRVLAPWVQAGSYVEMQIQGEIWTWHFDGQKCSAEDKRYASEHYDALASALKDAPPRHAAHVRRAHREPRLGRHRRAIRRIGHGPLPSPHPSQRARAAEDVEHSTQELVHGGEPWTSSTSQEKPHANGSGMGELEPLVEDHATRSPVRVLGPYSPPRIRRERGEREDPREEPSLAHRGDTQVRREPEVGEAVIKLPPYVTLVLPVSYTEDESSCRCVSCRTYRIKSIARYV